MWFQPSYSFAYIWSGPAGGKEFRRQQGVWQERCGQRGEDGDASGEAERRLGVAAEAFLLVGDDAIEGAVSGLDCVEGPELCGQALDGGAVVGDGRGGGESQVVVEAAGEISARRAVVRSCGLAKSPGVSAAALNRVRAARSASRSERRVSGMEKAMRRHWPSHCFVAE